ncbi:MAG: FAD-dependent pyridine nucleotide-disulfide oxidoreductase [Solirubrobacterales bacterium]|nr:FAD-dependent pyridine nucleotide-disulfide oxidoreductase [Solirubrobacterales bacterium]
MPAATRHRVVVVGGGFAGLQAALKLARTRAEVDVTLVDRRNFHLFQPLAYQVATGALSPSEICYPLRTIFRGRANVEVVLAEATGFDLDAREVSLRPSAAHVPAPSKLPYDSLLVAGGSRYSYFGHDDWHRYAPELKSLEGALDIRSRILTAFEAAELETDAERKRAWLTFAVVGAGPTGVEMAGQIAEIARDSDDEFPHTDTRSGQVLLIEGAERVLTGFPPSLSSSAQRALEHIGVTPLLRHMVTAIDAESVTTTSPDGSAARYPARTVVWAAGVAPSALARDLAHASGAELDRAGRLIVQQDLSLPGHPEVLALGDMVAVRRPDGVETLPGLAPVAMQQGRFAARAVLERIAGRKPGVFRYRDKGNLATIGRARAVADLKGLHLSGPVAWVTWLAVHLFYLIGFQNRLLVLTRWAFSFVAHGRGARLITDGGGASPQSPDD